MFTPKAFSASDGDALELVDSTPFAILVSSDGNAPVVTHVPILRDGHLLFGHLARANPHSNFLDGNVTAIFRGPHTYISPRWYVNGSRVPTWNYTAVHISGACRTITDTARQRQFIDRLVERFEGKKWAVNWDDSLYVRMMDAITFFEIDIEDISATFKLSQNHSAEDISAVIAALSESGDPADADVARLMDQLAGSE